MQVRLDRDVNGLYIRLHEGRVAWIVKVTDIIDVEGGLAGTTPGVEFGDDDGFIPFLRDRVDDDRLTLEVRALFVATTAD